MIEYVEIALNDKGEEYVVRRVLGDAKLEENPKLSNGNLTYRKIVFEGVKDSNPAVEKIVNESVLEKDKLILRQKNVPLNDDEKHEFNKNSVMTQREAVMPHIEDQLDLLFHVVTDLATKMKLAEDSKNPATQLEITQEQFDMLRMISQQRKSFPMPQKAIVTQEKPKKSRSKKRK